MAYTIKGKIINEKKLGNNVCKYLIKSGNETESYTYFGKGISNIYEIIITYDKQNNEKWGQQKIIKTVEYGEITMDEKIIKDLLINKIKITKTLTEKIINEHGTNSLNIIINEPKELKKIKHNKIEEQLKKIEEWKKDDIESKFNVYLTKYGIHTKHHSRIIKYYERDINELKEAMYDMYTCCEVPFDECDNAALKIGYARNNKARINAFIYMVYKKNNKNGILYLSKSDIKTMCQKYLIKSSEVIVLLVPVGLARVGLDPTSSPQGVPINHDNKKYYTTKCYYKKEKKIEEICMILANKKPNIHVEYDNDELIVTTLTDTKQRMAVKIALENCISIVNGAPGTGKTYIIQHITKKICEKNVMVYILAPTGAAVEKIKSDKGIKNLTYSNKIKIKTVHSFLGTNKLEDNNEKSIKKINKVYDEFVFFIDEMSMVSLNLMYEFLKIIDNIKTKTKLILLGDYDQLPSIESGDILKDMIKCEKIKCTTLTKNYRSEKCQSIIENAKLVLDGNEIKPDGKQLIYIETDLEHTFAKLKKIINKYEIDYKKSCILIPTRKNKIGTIEANKRLQKIYNSNGEQMIDNYKKNDKVMQNKNDYERDVYNGSILLVETIKDNVMECKYYEDDSDLSTDKYNIVKYEENKLKELELAYAMTIHKAQGKGYDDVIVIVHSSMYSMALNRNLLYTAITRAKQRCIIIGDKGGLDECKKKRPERVTNLFKNAEMR